MSKLKKIQFLKNGHVVRFKDSKGRWTKPDGRRKLISIIFKRSKKGKLVKTNMTFNPTKKGKPVATKLSTSRLKRISILNKRGSAEVKPKTPPQREAYVFSARATIEDNIIKKAVNFLQYAKKRKSGTFLILNYKIPDKLPPIRSEFIFKNFSTGLIVDELTRSIVSNVYKNKMRMSSLKDSREKNHEYLRRLNISFTWAGL